MEYYKRLTHGGEREVLVLAHSLDEAKQSVRPYVSAIIGSYPLINAFGALIKIDGEAALSALPHVKALGENAKVFAAAVAPPVLTETTGNGTGKRTGISIAVIDTGARAHLDYCMPTMRIRAFVDLINGKTAPYDDNGHGTAVCGLCAGNGLVSGGKKSVGYPKAGLVVIKALNERGEGSALKILEAMQWIYDHRHRYGIRVACMSLGCKPSSPDALSLGARALWKAGVTVVASAGNLGPKQNSVTSPGICPEIITVGAFCERGGKRIMADFSSRGAKNSVKPELLANGVDVSVTGNSEHYTVMSGTSVAAPRVAALAARLLAENPDYTPDRVKEALLERSEKQQSPPPYGIIAD